MNTKYNYIINMAFSCGVIIQKERETLNLVYFNVDKDVLIKIATEKKIIPHLASFFLTIKLDDEFWKPKYDFYKKRNEGIVTLVDSVFSELHNKGVNKVFAYENFGALLSSGNDLALYSSGDVDLFADISQKNTIYEVMSSLGYHPTESIFERRNIMTEFKSDNPEDDFRINFDWIPLRRLRFPIPINIDDIVEWDNLRKYKETNISLPSKEALLYLCALRIAVHGYSRSPDVRMIFDMTNASTGNPDWKKVIEWARKDGYETKLFAVTLIAYKLNSIKVPDWVVELAMSNKNAIKILKECYSEDEKSLIYDPTGIKLMRIEAMSDNRSLFGQILTMLFPKKRWLSYFYSEPGDSVFKMYINYYKHLL